MARVSLVGAGNDIYQELTGVIDSTGEQFVQPGDRVLIKPNLVEPKEPNSGEITTPGLIEAVARYCLDCGAGKVIIGEGPSYYQPQSYLRKCFTETGVSNVAERLGIDWVLFDEHHYRTFRGVPDCPKEFRVTEFAFNCDRIINLPVLKTHYQTTVTLAMKNLKGCLKREDKPRFHQVNLAQAVVALNKIVRPTINIIDGTPKTIGSIGDTGKKRAGAGLLIAGTDIVAVDAVGSALMGIDPAEVSTVALGAAAGLGEMDLTRLDIDGEELKQMSFTVRLPRERLQQSFPQLEIIGTEAACSGCLIPLVSSLWTLEERGINQPRPLNIYIGEEPEEVVGSTYLRVGDCAVCQGVSGANEVRGCPPDREELLRSLAKIMNE